MCPPATASVPDISHHCSDEEIFVSLEKLVCGGPPPMNVIPDVNPHDYRPENLPVGFWYFIVLQSHRATEHGSWKAIGERHRIFSNDSICGWRTTYRFCDQQSSNTSRAEWLMQEYTITQNGIDVKTIGKEANALCRVLRNHPSSTEQELHQGFGPAGVFLGKPGNSTDSRDFNCLTRESEASTSYRRVNNIEAAVIVARDDPIEQENVPDADREDFLRDYLEIDDLLDIPPSPSSSSSNSSCLTMSSDQCFVSLGLLQDIENEIMKDMEKKGADHKFSVAPVKQDMIVGYALFPVSSIRRIEEEIPTARNEIALSLPALATTDKTTGDNLPNQGITERRQNCDNNPAARSRAMIASSSHARPSTTGKLTDAGEGGTRVVCGLKCSRNCASCPFSCHGNLEILSKLELW